MPPKQRVDLDLDALAPPNRTLRLGGKVYELPGDMPIETVIHAMQLQAAIESEDGRESLAAINELLEIIYGLFRLTNDDFEPMPLSLGNIVQILGLVLSGMDIDFDEAVRETLVGEGAEMDEQPEDGADHPPTSLEPPAAVPAARRSRSRKPSPALS